MSNLHQHLNEHLERLRSLNFSPLTIRHSRYSVAAFLRWLEAGHDLVEPDRLRAKHLHAWQKHLSERTTVRGHLLKARSINKHVECLRRFLKFLVETGLAAQHLQEAIQFVKEPRMLPGSVLAHEQMRRLLGTAIPDTPTGYRLRTMLEVLYSSGLRVAELLGMNVGDVDFKYGTVRVMGKGRKERVVPVGKTALQYLESYLRAVRAAATGIAEQKALFVDGTGKRFPYYTFRRQVKVCAKRAGLEIEVTPHTFRRSCTTELLRGGANMYYVKELLGHESLETLRHYAQLTIHDLKREHQKCHPRERDARQSAR